jgi:hydroxymethylpyrimidine kinase/phosphomethylpyrimidine kinase
VQPVVALSIAGSDSGGGAGIQADIRSMNAFGVFATTAVTALTAQNTRGVEGVFAVEPEFVEAQVRAVTSDFEIRATKTGMLAEPRIIERVALLAREGLLPHLVVDPVLVATSGDVLLSEGGLDAYRRALFSQAEIVTPNLAEAAALAGADVREVTDVDALSDLARALLIFGSRYVLVKGGHLTNRRDGERSPDVLVSAEGLVVLDAPRIATGNDHGTGCSLSSAIAAGLALGRSLPDAVRDAKSFVLAALEGAASWQLGKGRGPIDHLDWGQ